MSYRTITKEADAEFTERRSRFIGHAMPVSSEEDALAFVAMIKEQHGDATHNVWAYNLKNGRQRYSDDGEPQGTAGPPVLEVLQKERLVDAAVVVTRYFGGVLLGAGGLVRAYSHGAKLALEAACPRSGVFVSGLAGGDRIRAVWQAAVFAAGLPRQGAGL